MKHQIQMYFINIYGFNLFGIFFYINLLELSIRYILKYNKKKFQLKKNSYILEDLLV